MQRQDHNSAGKLTVFISSVPGKEVRMRRALIIALSPLLRQGLITLLFDGNLLLGENMESALLSRLPLIDLVLLLVSPTCIDTQSWDRQMRIIWEQRSQWGFRVVPILLRRTVGWHHLPFGSLSVLPQENKPISAFRPQEEGWYQVVERLYTLLTHWPGHASSPVVLPVLSTQVPQLHPSTHVPRSQLVREIYQRVSGDEVSALVLTGVWGLGKSALAVQVCHFAEQERHLGRGPFQEAPLWLEIESTSSLLDIFVTLAQVSGISLPAVASLSPAELVAALISLLNNQPGRLIVLNQLENWLDPQTRTPRATSGGLGQWLDLLNSQLSTSRLLCTSRLAPQSQHHPLAMYVQHYQVPALTSLEGMQLLRLGASLSAEPAASLASAVTYYQGHPLALTLLHNLLNENPSLTLQTLLEDLSYKQLLVQDMAKHLLQYIYEHELKAEQRTLLLAFALYRQPAPLSAAQSIAQSASDLSSPLYTSTLRILLNQNLLQATGQGMYRVPVVIRDFLLTQREESPELQAQKHLLAAEDYKERFFKLPGQTADQEMLLLEAAWHTTQAGEFANAVSLLRREQLFLSLRRRGANSLLLDLYQQLLPPEKWGADPLTAGHLYAGMGSIQNALGEKQAALEAYQHALPFFRESDQPAQIAEAFNEQGALYRALKEYSRAQECYQEAWTICEQAGESFPQRGVTLNNRGRLLYEQAEQLRSRAEARTLYRQALTFYEQALVVHRQTQQPEEEGWTLLNLGDVTAALGEELNSYGFYQQALALWQQLGERRGEGMALNNLGLLLAQEKRMFAHQAEPTIYYRQALRLFRLVGDRWQEQTTWRNLARWLLLHAPPTSPQREQSYLQGLACFRVARNLPIIGPNNVPSWLQESFHLELGEERMHQLWQEVENHYWQITEALLNE